MARQFVTDCEGPVSLNDNALELSAHYIPNGEAFFAKLSRYDDYLADVEKRPRYKAGDTLRLILPFLKAYGATDQGIADFCKKNICLVDGAPELLRFVTRVMPSFIISTSYAPYIRALCEVVAFPFENTYCTRVDLDKYELGADEIAKLKAFSQEIDQLPPVDFPGQALTLDDVPEASREAIKRIDEIVWGKIAKLGSGAMLDEVNPIGGHEKARAVEDSIKRTGNELSDVMYVGDSITDVEALELVKRGGGLAVSFNGNRYAIEAAEVALISENAYVTQGVADAFLTGGKAQVFRLLKEWRTTIIEKIPWQAAVITAANREDLVKKSGTLRQKMRGVAGTLG